MPTIVIASAIAALALIGSMACASKGLVRTNVGEVREKIDSLSTSLEQTQERVQQNEARISEVDQEAQAALKAAQQASQSATAAGELAKEAAAEAEALEKASGRLVYEVVMSEAESGFRFDSAQLPDAVKKQIDDLVAQLKQQPRNVLITIEGHTDRIGSTAVNERIGLERAKSVEQYLYEEHQIPLHKMEVISYGEENPVAPNTTRAGRAQNRRVVIKVLA